MDAFLDPDLIKTRKNWRNADPAWSSAPLAAVETELTSVVMFLARLQPHEFSCPANKGRYGSRCIWFSFPTNGGRRLQTRKKKLQGWFFHQVLWSLALWTSWASQHARHPVTFLSLLISGVWNHIPQIPIGTTLLPKLLLIAAPQIKANLRPETWASSALHSFVARPAKTFRSLGFGSKFGWNFQES